MKKEKINPEIIEDIPNDTKSSIIEKTLFFIITSLMLDSSLRSRMTWTLPSKDNY